MDLAQFETDLWEAADNLRANSKTTGATPSARSSSTARRRTAMTSTSPR